MSKSLIKRTAALLAAFTLSLSLTGNGFAADNSDPTDLTDLTDQTVTVAMVDYPRYLRYDENGEPYGYAYEYLMKLREYTDIEYKFVKKSYSDIEEALLSGEVDLVAGAQKTDSRAEKYVFSESEMCTGGPVLCVLPNNTDYAFNDYSGYDGIRIAARSDSSVIGQAREKLDESGIEYEIDLYENETDCREALMLGNADAMLISAIRCDNEYKIIARLGYSRLYFMINPEKPWIKSKIDAAMDEIDLISPYYNETLWNKYYGNLTVSSELSQDEKSYAASAPTITVAVYPNRAPIEYYDAESKEFRGIAISTLEKIAEFSGLRFNFVERNNSTLVDSLEKGVISLTLTSVELGGTTDPLVELSDSYYRNSVYAVLPASADSLIDSSRRLIIKRDSHILSYMAESMGFSDISLADDYWGCVDAVSSGKADIAFIPVHTVEDLVGTDYYSDLRKFILLDSSFDFSFGVSKKADPLLISILNKGLASIGEFEKNRIIIDNIIRGKSDFGLNNFFAENRTLVFGLCGTAMVLLIAVISIVAITRSHAAKRLKIEADRANEANAAKAEFLSRMSHDMRTPMNGIIGMTALTRDIPGLPEEAKKNLTAINDSSQYLMSLINDTLDMNKIESRKIELHNSPVISTEYFLTLAAAARQSAAAKGIGFDYNTENTRTCYISLDKVRVHQIFYNLLSNAVKFTPEGGTVSFTVETESRSKGFSNALFTVKDNGVGMSPEFLEKAFEPFEQEYNTESDKYVGTGLGLSIVKNLVDLMGGTISVKSKLGEGTEFAVRLKIQRLDGYAPKPSPILSHEILAGKNALICEDHPINATIVQKLLEKVGMTSEIAENGLMGVNYFSEHAEGFYDVILMDIRMPVMSGHEATRQIRALDRPDAKTIPIIAMTANAFDSDVNESLAAGMSAHLSKPIEPKLLYDTIAEKLKKN